MNPKALFSAFEWHVAWRYLRARGQTHFRAKWEPVRVKEMRANREGGAP